MRFPRSEANRDEPNATGRSRRTVLRRTALGATALTLGVPHLTDAATAAETTDDGGSVRAGSLSLVQTLANPDPDPDDGFGGVVALSRDGTTALVGPLVTDAFEAYVFASTADGWTHTATLSNPRPDSDNGFGDAVALSGDGSTALVGAPRDDTASGEDTGAAHVFARTASRWTHTGTLSNPGRYPWLDDFGNAVALSGDGSTALVGTPGADDLLGTVHVFARTASGWAHTGALSNPRGLYHFFGHRVALSDDGETALVSASVYDGALPTGEAYVFASTADGWAHVGTLSNPEWRGDDRFGDAVALSGDGRTALVGAPSDDVGGPDDVGAVHAFAATTDEWTYAGTFSHPDPEPHDRFGGTMALNGDGTVALVGYESGRAHLFTRTASEWTHTDTISSPAPDSDGDLGGGLGLSGDGDTALVGASKHDTADGENVGAAYVYARDAFPAPIPLKNGDEVTPKDRDGDGLYEDLDGDGGTDGRDVQFLARLANDYRKGRVRLTDAQVEALDFDGDGAFTKADVRAYARTYL